MPESFESPLDIARRACQHLGERMITDFGDTSSVAAKEFGESYSRLRDFELERAIWAFSIRRAVLRPVTDTTFLWTPPTYANATTYAAGEIVAYTPVTGTSASFPTVTRSRPIYWQTEASVVGEKPDVSYNWHRYCGVITGDAFSTSTSFFTGEIVSSGGLYYMSLISANTDTPPSSNWLLLGGTTATLQVFYPLGTGPAADSGSFNILRLPYGFMRTAPRYLFDSTFPYLGADIAPSSDDWNIEGNYAVTRLNTIDLMRFVGNVIDVPDMHAMFCETLAARMAYEGCERVTGSIDKRKECLTAYEFFGNQARLVNAILDGEPRSPQSEYITCRL